MYFYIRCRDSADTIIPAIIFPSKTPKNASFILIFNIDATADAVHVPVVGSGTPTKSIIPSIDIFFNFFILEAIFLSTFFTNPSHIFISLKKCIICLNVSINGIATNVEPTTLAIYTPIGFSPRAIPIGIAPLNSVIGIIDKIIIFKYAKFSSYDMLFS